MPRRWISSVILVAVFALGLAAGIVGMVYAWPGVRSHFRHHNEPLAHYLQRTLSLNQDQFTRVDAILKDNFARQHQIHLEFKPKYAQVCTEFAQIVQQEHDTYVPVRQQTFDQLKAVMTPAQWTKFQKQRSENRTPSRRPDLCRQVLRPSPPASGASPGSSKPPQH